MPILNSQPWRVGGTMVRLDLRRSRRGVSWFDGLLAEVDISGVFLDVGFLLRYMTPMSQHI